MNRILQLDKSVSEMIAAGEVVERPASAVKELLENSIDAGATAVTLEIKNGGVSFIRVTDNGSGILRDDLKAAFTRHATSKVRTAEDLDAIGTLGFRGEALASISAVSRMEMITRTQEELSGSRIRLDGGVVAEIGDAGCPQGTTILVRELFYNTPARMKFLKKDVSEGNAVAAVVERIALSHPEVSVKFIRDGRQELHTPGDSKLISAIHGALGREFASGLIPADYTLNGVRITGYIVKPVNARASRTMQNFFLNGRLIRSKTAAAALDEAYKGSIMVGRYPACVLLMELSPSLVDVNVHPAKIEVRFANEKQIFDAVYYAVKNALAALDPRPELAFKKSAPVSFPKFEAPGGEAKPQLTIELPRASAVSTAHPSAAGIMQSTARPVYEPIYSGTVTVSEPEAAKLSILSQPMPQQRQEPLENLQPEQQAERQTEPVRIKESPSGNALTDSESAPVIKEQVAKTPDYRIAGQCFDTYLLVETGDELLLIDKHAAHERVLYEELKKKGETAAQQLLAPVTVSFTHEEYEALIGHLALLRDAGFAAEDFGGATLLVRAAPVYLGEGEISAVLCEMAGCLIAGKKDLTPQKLDALYHSVACRAAIKGGDKTGPDEADRLVRLILMFDDIRYCPHGRPVAMVLKRSDIEKQFGRA